MPKVTAATLAVTGLLLIALTGCAGSTEDAGNERTAPVASETATPEASAAPLVAETAAPTADSDETFLTYVRENLPATTQIPDATDQQLIESGHAACEQLESGVAHSDVRLIEGEQPNGADVYADSSAIMNGAVLAYCPAFL